MLRPNWQSPIPKFKLSPFSLYNLSFVTKSCRSYDTALWGRCNTQFVQNFMSISYWSWSSLNRSLEDTVHVLSATADGNIVVMYSLGFERVVCILPIPTCKCLYNCDALFPYPGNQFQRPAYVQWVASAVDGSNLLYYCTHCMQWATAWGWFTPTLAPKNTIVQTGWGWMPKN